MRKNLMLLLAAVLIGFSSFAQCSWSVTSGIINASCNGNCDGKIVLVIDNPPAGSSFTFLWSSGQNTHYIDKICAGSYTVTITDDKGCSATYTYTITQPKVLEVNCVATVSTAPGTLTANVSGGTPPYSYTWNTIPPQYTQTITNVPAGSYIVTVEDANKCAGSSSCKIDAGTTCGGRTQTQGGWGAVPKGNNPGTYLHAHFAAAFPNGLTIGCINTLKLTSAQKVTDFLPSGTTPKALPAGNMVDNISYQNVLAGQLVSATLSIGFDYENPNFSPASITLDNQIITNGPFAGKTVGFLVAEANKKIGGCASSYSLGQLNAALDSVNQNYDNGNQNHGYLACEPKKRITDEVVSENGLLFKVYPNPFSTVAHLEFRSVKDSHVTVELLDLTGRVVKSLFQGDVMQDATTTLDVNSDELRNGIYILKIKSDGDVYNQRLFVQK